VLPAEPQTAGAVLVHGDYGPNNALLDSDASAAILAQCQRLLDLCRRWSADDAVRSWEQRLEITAGWVE